MTPTMDELRAATPQELVDALMNVSPSQAAAIAARYKALKAARYVTEDGDVLDAKEYDREVELCKEQLKRYIERYGDLEVEGVGRLRLQERSTTTQWDCVSMADSDYDLFLRLLKLGAVTLNTKVADALEKAGQVTGFRGYGMKGGTTALVIDKE